MTPTDSEIIAQAVEKVGTLAALAERLDAKAPAVRKWVERGTIPRWYVGRVREIAGLPEDTRPAELIARERRAARARAVAEACSDAIRRVWDRPYTPAKAKPAPRPAVPPARPATGYAGALARAMDGLHPLALLAALGSEQ